MIEHPKVEGLEDGVKSLPSGAAADAVRAQEFRVEVATPDHEVVSGCFVNGSLMPAERTLEPIAEALAVPLWPLFASCPPRQHGGGEEHASQARQLRTS